MVHRARIYPKCYGGVGTRDEGNVMSTLKFFPYVWYAVVAVGIYIGASCRWDLLPSIQKIASGFILVLVVYNFADRMDPLRPLGLFAASILLFATGMSVGRLARWVVDAVRRL